MTRQPADYSYDNRETANRVLFGMGPVKPNLEILPMAVLVQACHGDMPRCHKEPCDKCTRVPFARVAPAVLSACLSCHPTVVGSGRGHVFCSCSNG